jgi:hypothetical protein
MVTLPALAPGYFFERTVGGRVALFQYDGSKQVMQWYDQGAGMGRRHRVRDLDDRAVPAFDTEEEGRQWLRQHRWGRVILREEA